MMHYRVFWKLDALPVSLNAQVKFNRTDQCVVGSQATPILHKTNSVLTEAKRSLGCIIKRTGQCIDQKVKPSGRNAGQSMERHI